MNRKHLEYDIIGACIIENAFGSIVHILKSINFSQPECRYIYKTMSTIWPNSIINMHMLHRKMSTVKRLEYSWPYYISKVTQYTVGASDLVNNAILLLELDFKDKMATKINNYRKLEQDFKRKIILDELYSELMHPAVDVFTHLDLSIRYLHTHNMQELADELREMASQIDTRARMIRLLDRKEILKNALAKVELEEAELNRIINQRNQVAA